MQQPPNYLLKQRSKLYHNFIFFAALLFYTNLNAQVKWINVNDRYTPLPNGMNVYTTIDSLDGKPFRAYYVKADLKNKTLTFTTDTTYKRRLTPAQFFKKNESPLLVVNSTFFSFATNQNLNIVIKNGQLVSYNIHSTAGKAADTLTYRHSLNGALGISKKRSADVAWIYTDSSKKFAYASQEIIESWKDSFSIRPFSDLMQNSPMALKKSSSAGVKKWKMQTAVGGGPVLVQNGAIKITNNEELKFTGKAINDMHPRTLMGYTKNNQLIIMVIEGRNPGIADGASLIQAAQLMIELGCKEALNLDGGGSSCMLINGKETIKPSDKGLERPVPAVFIIQEKVK